MATKKKNEDIKIDEEVLLNDKIKDADEIITEKKPVKPKKKPVKAKVTKGFFIISS